MNKPKPWIGVTVEDLRAAGWDVDVYHYRRYMRPATEALVLAHEDPDEMVPIALPEKQDTGGRTTVDITPPGQPTTTYHGEADAVHPDQYCYAKGRMIALGRALKRAYGKGCKMPLPGSGRPKKPEDEDKDQLRAVPVVELGRSVVAV